MNATVKVAAGDPRASFRAANNPTAIPKIATVAELARMG